MASAEEKVEEFYKAQLDELNIRHYGKTEEINSSITKALKEADSKSGGSGNKILIFSSYYKIVLAAIFL